MVWTLKEILVLAASGGALIFILAFAISYLCEFHMERRIEKETDKALLLIRYAANAMKEVGRDTIKESVEIGKSMFKDIE